MMDEREKIFLVTRRPRDFLGFLKSLLFDPCGNCFFICSGEQYKFSNYSFKKSGYKPKKHDKLEEVFVSKKDLESQLGAKWNALTNNCFTVAERILKKNAERKRGDERMSSPACLR